MPSVLVVCAILTYFTGAVVVIAHIEGEVERKSSPRKPGQPMRLDEEIVTAIYVICLALFWPWLLFKARSRKK